MKKILFILLLLPAVFFGQATGLVISNKASGGAIGTAAATVDAATLFNLNQTTAGQTLTVPNLTNASAGKIIYINNIGSASLTLSPGGLLPVGYGVVLRWTGSSWSINAPYVSGAVDSSLSGHTVPIVGTKSVDITSPHVNTISTDSVMTATPKFVFKNTVPQSGLTINQIICRDTLLIGTSDYFLGIPNAVIAITPEGVASVSARDSIQLTTPVIELYDPSRKVQFKYLYDTVEFYGTSGTFRVKDGLVEIVSDSMIVNPVGTGALGLPFGVVKSDSIFMLAATKNITGTISGATRDPNLLMFSKNSYPYNVSGGGAVNNSFSVLVSDIFKFYADSAFTLISAKPTINSDSLTVTSMSTLGALGVHSGNIKNDSLIVITATKNINSTLLNETGDAYIVTTSKAVGQMFGASGSQIFSKAKLHSIGSDSVVRIDSDKRVMLSASDSINVFSNKFILNNDLVITNDALSGLDSVRFGIDSVVILTDKVKANSFISIMDIVNENNDSPGNYRVSGIVPNTSFTVHGVSGVVNRFRWLIIQTD